MLIQELNDMATRLVGDAQSPNLYFVTDRANVVMVSADATAAYNYWLALAARRPHVESALEDRQHGVLASVEPRSDADGRLAIFDDFGLV